MTTATAAHTTATITLGPSAEFPGRLDVRVDGDRLGTVIDGGHIIRNADRVLKANRVLRATGYDLDANRQLVATGARLS